MQVYSVTRHSRWRRIRNLAIYLLVFAVFACIGIVASLLWPKSYIASAVVMAPDSARIASINQITDLARLESGSIEQGLYDLASQLQIDSDQAFYEFISAYISADTRRIFFLKRELYRLQDYQSVEDSIAFRHLIAEFSSRFDHEISNNENGTPQATLYFRYHNPEGSAELLNAFSDHAAGIAASNLVRQQKEKIAQFGRMLDRAVDYYQLLRQSVVQEQSNDSSLVGNELYARAYYEHLVDIRYRQLRSAHLASEFDDYSPKIRNFKPIRSVSLANAEGSVETPDRMLIILITMLFGLVTVCIAAGTGYIRNTAKVLNE